jgi:hypothetical protein
MAIAVAIVAVGAMALLGAHAISKRRERRRIENGYLTFHDNAQTGAQYGNSHYGTGSHQRGNYQHHHNRSQSHSGHGSSNRRHTTRTYRRHNSTTYDFGMTDT